MSLPEAAFSLWLLFSILPLWVVWVIAVRTLRRDRETGPSEPRKTFPFLEVFVPIKGIFPDHEQVLTSLLEQSYPSYAVTFIVESLDDPANQLADRLCEAHEHANKVISGNSVSCAQKNHNLVEGTKHVRPETKILVFCDSTNMADPDWLVRLTDPLRRGENEVVTTFRAFDPDPETLGGVCQAIYAMYVRLLTTVQPKPWGGATAISRRTFERLNVTQAWSSTVVDDLILGNVLDHAGIAVRVKPAELLRSPLKNHTVKAFLSYLDRQILFPKFTNPDIWGKALCTHLNLTLATVVSAVTAGLFFAGHVGAIWGWSACIFLGVLTIFALLLRRMNPIPISLFMWIVSFLPCIFLAAGIFARSLFRNHIDWHGKRYWPTKGGVVKRIDLLRDERQT